ncbi:MAG: GAF domain-containing protein, partial [Deltaproteobacteria bacterium]|nr:GAF domain-containing protein [Deltaproteobacteria bacterium]
ARVSEPAPVQMPAAQAPAARVQPAQVPPEPAAAARVARLVPARVPPEPEPAWETSYQAPAGTLTIGRSLDFTSESTADLLEEVFEISDKISETRRFEDALYLILDLAMEKVSTDSGSVFLADINSDDLVFGAARGPKASQVKGFKLKMGQGIVGFCAAEGIGLAVSDVTRDPRFYSTISQKVGYNTRSILCVPMQADGRVMGALELINKRAGNVFTERDLGVASFLGQHLARYLASRERK